MKQLKRFEYSIDNGFMKGAFYAVDEKKVHKYLRKLLGWKLYLQVRESIVIKEVRIMKYVYLIYDDWHGLIGICATLEKATEMVKKDAFEGGLPEDTPLDYDDEDSWGWEGASWWQREEVIE